MAVCHAISALMKKMACAQSVLARYQLTKKVATYALLVRLRIQNSMSASPVPLVNTMKMVEFAFLVQEILEILKNHALLAKTMQLKTLLTINANATQDIKLMVMFAPNAKAC